MMEKVLAAVGGGVLFAGLVFFITPLSTLFGAVGGWIVGLFFQREILSMLGAMGLHGITMWQLGATLGFCGSFLRTSTTVKKS